MDAEIITIHVTETERKRIEDFAQERGVGVDEFVRMVVLNLVTEQVEPGSSDDRVDMLAEFRQSWRDARRTMLCQWTRYGKNSMTSKPLVSIAATPPFIKALKRLKKKYPRIADDLKTLTDSNTAKHPATRYVARDIRSTKSG